MENSQLESLNGGIITQIEKLGNERIKTLWLIAQAEQALRELPEVIKLNKVIEDCRNSLAENEAKENELRETAKWLMLEAGLKDFHLANGTKIALQYTPGAIVIEDESKVPEKYWKEKVTKSIDKTALKKDFNAGEQFDQSIYVQKDIKLVITFV